MSEIEVKKFNSNKPSNVLRMILEHMSPFLSRYPDGSWDKTRDLLCLDCLGCGISKSCMNKCPEKLYIKVSEVLASKNTNIEHIIDEINHMLFESFKSFELFESPIVIIFYITDDIHILFDPEYGHMFYCDGTLIDKDGKLLVPVEEILEPKETLKMPIDLETEYNPVTPNNLMLFMFDLMKCFAKKTQCM